MSIAEHLPELVMGSQTDVVYCRCGAEFRTQDGTFSAHRLWADRLVATQQQQDRP